MRPYILVVALHGAVSLLIAAGGLWLAFQVLAALPPPGSDWFEILVIGVGALTALAIAGGALWIFVQSVRDEWTWLRESKGIRSTTSRGVADPSMSGAGAAMSGETSSATPGEWAADGAASQGPETSGVDPVDSTGDSCDIDVGGDSGCDMDSGGMDSGGAGW